MHLRNLVRYVTSPPTSGPSSILVVRMMAGAVFLSEGLLKFVYTNQGVGRFTKLGMPVLMTGLGTRLLSLPFIVEMVVAVLSTKIGLFFGTSPLPRPAAPPFTGWWAVLHESRSDYAQLLCCLFLFLAGPGPWSIDALLQRWRRSSRPSATESTSGIVTVASA
jgi:uncharacterized membrane protein YphA (DoxX/SURF4 family)